MPVLSGSTTHCIATAAIAASTALPPARNMSSAVRVASGCEVAAMPFAAIAAERPGLLKSRISLPFAPVMRHARLYGGLSACTCRWQGSSLARLSLIEDNMDGPLDFPVAEAP